MKIEILYVAECPSHPAAVKLVRDVLSSEGLSADVREVLITDETVGAALGFRGSPTIRIDGRDVAGEPATKRRQVSGLVVDFIRDHLKSAFRRRTRCVARWLPPERRADHEAGDRHLGIVRRGLEFRRDHRLLSAARFRRGSGSWRGERVLHDAASLAIGTFGCVDRTGILATASAKQCSVPGRRFGMVLLWAAVAVVLGMILFPQEIAAFIADRLDGAWKL